MPVYTHRWDLCIARAANGSHRQVQSILLIAMVVAFFRGARCSSGRPGRYINDAAGSTAAACPSQAHHDCIMLPPIQECRVAGYR
jgi:hypothetical protein